MKNSAKVCLVILLLLSVITVFISPAVALQPTALRALKFSNALFALLALAGTMAASLFSHALPEFVIVSRPDRTRLLAPSLVEMNCTRLC